MYIIWYEISIVQNAYLRGFKIPQIWEEKGHLRDEVSL